MSAKERPILFSSPMVRALLAGTKTQTRRVVKVQPPERFGRVTVMPLSIETAWSDDAARETFTTFAWGNSANVKMKDLWLRCPYGTVGDRLWVREAWSPYGISSTPASISDATYAVFPDGAQKFKGTAGYFAGAFDGGKKLEDYSPQAFDNIKYRPGIHMPRWASRITLEITGVKVERLNDISEEDAAAEGVESTKHWPQAKSGHPTQPHRIAFQWLWREINGEESLRANPWVWCVSFKRIAA